jgi:hypothetical protein
MIATAERFFLPVEILVDATTARVSRPVDPAQLASTDPLRPAARPKFNRVPQV